MEVAGKVVIALVAVIHLYIFFFEAFAWETRGPKVFKHFPKDLFSQTKSMALNQGVYNLFLALGLIWTFFIKNQQWQENIALFFLGCVAFAGLVGAFSASRKILYVQTIPALVGILIILFA